MKYQSKSTKIDSFKQKKMQCHSPGDEFLHRNAYRRRGIYISHGRYRRTGISKCTLNGPENQQK